VADPVKVLIDVLQCVQEAGTAPIVFENSLLLVARDSSRESRECQMKQVVTQTDLVLRQAQHERREFMISIAIPFALSLLKGERYLGNSPEQGVIL
jgi:hypothetical protein